MRDYTVFFQMEIGQVQRLSWLDVAKGITIVLMVLGHSSIPIPLSRWIYSFHMPLFFIASGFVTNWGINDFLSYTRKKLQRLILPFIIYSIICYFILTIYLNTTIDPVVGWGGYALWFVPVLFVSNLISFMIFKTPKLVFYVLLVLLPFLSVAFDVYDIALPWNMTVVPYATFFILSGTILRKNLFIEGRNSIIVGLLCFTTSVLISHYWRLDMASNTVTPVVPLTVGALSGTVFVFMLSRIIDVYIPFFGKVFSIVGKETFMIIAFSQVIIMSINHYMNIGSIMKYLLLIIVLVALCFVKNIIVKTIRTIVKK